MIFFLSPKTKQNNSIGNKYSKEGKSLTKIPFYCTKDTAKSPLRCFTLSALLWYTTQYTHPPTASHLSTKPTQSHHCHHRIRSWTYKLTTIFIVLTSSADFTSPKTIKTHQQILLPQILWVVTMWYHTRKSPSRRPGIYGYLKSLIPGERKHIYSRVK